MNIPELDVGADSSGSDAESSDGADEFDAADVGPAYHEWLLAGSVDCADVNEVSYGAPPSYPSFPVETATVGGIITKSEALAGPIEQFELTYRLGFSARAYRVGATGVLISDETPVRIDVVVASSEQDSTTRLSATVLLDYEPVEANWAWQDETGEGLDFEATGSGINTAFDERAEAFSATIPYSPISEPGYHEAVLVVHLESDGKVLGSSTARVGIWNLGPGRSAHPCFEQVSTTDAMPAESAAAQQLFGSAVLNTHIETDPEATENGVTLSVGESIEVDYFVRGDSTFGDRSYQAVIVPTVDGVPFGEPQYILTEPARWSADIKETVFRSSYNFSSDVPGTFNLGAVMIRNAWIAEVWPNGVVGNRTGIRDGVSSMTLRVKVE